MKAGLAKLAWTTNFDPLIADGAAKVFDSTGALTSIALDAPDLAVQAIAQQRWPIELKLHADCRAADTSARSLRISGEQACDLGQSASVGSSPVQVGTTGQCLELGSIDRDFRAAPGSGRQLTDERAMISELKGRPFVDGPEQRHEPSPIMVSAIAEDRLPRAAVGQLPRDFLGWLPVGKEIRQSNLVKGRRILRPNALRAPVVGRADEPGSAGGRLTVH
jgi:hypothetical protein